MRWLLSNTCASSICALDWCPIVNAAASSLHLAQSVGHSSAVPVNVPGHVLLPVDNLESHTFPAQFDAVIDTNVAVFNLDYPPLFPEKLREIPQLEQHLRSISKLMRNGGLATLLCRGAATLDVVDVTLQSLCFDVIHTIRCLGTQQESPTTTLTDQVSYSSTHPYPLQIAITVCPILFLFTLARRRYGW